MSSKILLFFGAPEGFVSAIFPARRRLVKASFHFYSRMIIAIILMLASDSWPGSAQGMWRSSLPALKVSENGRFLVRANGEPFFYLGDTAWELFHRLDRKQALAYFDLRASQRFNVIQAVALAELDGLTVPNAYGDLPLIERDPAQPAVTPGANPAKAEQYDYWDHVEYLIDEANRRGIYIGMLPTWGRWVPNPKAGNSNEFVFTLENARSYGEFLGKRFGRKGIIWILGGDRSAAAAEEIWRALARGIAIGIHGREDYTGLIMSYHPGGGYTSSEWFHNDPWLTVNMQQTGHGASTRSWERIASDYQRKPAKPVMDAEPLYEDHPLSFRARELGYSFDAHVRQRAYWDIFSGAFGHTYGNHSVWQMYSPGKRRINGPLFYWFEAIHRPGAAQMRHLRALVESRPFLSRIPDQTIIVDVLKDADHIAGTRGDGYLFIYSAQGRPFTVNLGKISGSTLEAWWFNPRTGSSEEIGSFKNIGTRQFSPPSEGFGSDWVLVIDDGSMNFPPPGQTTPSAGRKKTH
jgi:hypothetical protein